MAKYKTLTELFTAIANSLRGKTGGGGAIVADDFPSVIDSLSTGGITPNGTKTITSNGTHDVTSYASAQVNVPTGITPTGTKTITENGSHDVTNYATAQVNVPVGITPSGSLNITANGTHDVTNYASAVVNVPVPSEKMIMRTITVSSDQVGASGKTVTLLTGDSFLKAHYSHDGLSAVLYSTSPIAGENGAVHFVYHSNGNIGSTGAARTGLAIKSTSASAITVTHNTAKLAGSGYNVSLRLNSAGTLSVYLASGFTLKAGTYTLIAFCTDE